MMHLVAGSALFSSLATAAHAQQCGATHVDDFAAQNQGAWRWGGPFESIAPTGGFPAAHLVSIDLDTFAPMLETTGSSIFTGDYRAQGVTALAVDLQSFGIDFPTSCQRPLSLVLENDNGTPGNPFDDLYVYFVMALDVPCVDGLWHSYSVAVPAQSATLPTGWNVDPNFGGAPNSAWNQVITSVSRVRWFFGDPTFFFIFQMWDIGADNPSISFHGGASTYCLSQRNSAGCQPHIRALGTASASSAQPFLVTLDDVLNQRSGICFYGLGGQQVPFQGGALCVLPPTRRTPLQNSGGSTSGNDCSGGFAFDFNALVQSGVDPALVPGVRVFGQYWSRDALAGPHNKNLSNAVSFGICL
jgi:hypothetical protein